MFDIQLFESYKLDKNLLKRTRSSWCRKYWLYTFIVHQGRYSAWSNHIKKHFDQNWNMRMFLSCGWGKYHVTWKSQSTFVRCNWINAAGMPMFTSTLSLDPASSSSTVFVVSSDNLLATTQPELPAPTNENRRMQLNVSSGVAYLQNMYFEKNGFKKFVFFICLLILKQYYEICS